MDNPEKDLPKIAGVLLRGEPDEQYSLIDKLFPTTAPSAIPSSTVWQVQRLACCQSIANDRSVLLLESAFSLYVLTSQN